MKLIIGLGNPGAKYNFTRHNVGFLALDYYFKIKGLKWNENPKFGAIYAREGEVLFIKPQEYYNETGKVANEFMRYYKIPTSDILVICDNFDLEFGKIRYRASGLAGGNNGLKSLDKAIGASMYPRIRVGTGNDELRRKMGDMDFVLSRFTPTEKAKLPEILQRISSEIDDWLN